MNLEEARRDVFQNIAEQCEPVDPETTRKYARELEEDYPKYLIESRAAAKKTAELSKIVCVG